MGSPRDPAVDCVERQGQGGQADEEGPVVHAHERRGHQCGDRLAERGADQRDDVARTEAGHPGTVERDRQQAGGGRRGEQADGPADGTEADRCLDHGQDGHEQDDPRDRCSLNRAHETSVLDQ